MDSDNDASEMIIENEIMPEPSELIEEQPVQQRLISQQSDDKK